jgi:hypothetical protein
MICCIVVLRLTASFVVLLLLSALGFCPVMAVLFFFVPAVVLWLPFWWSQFCCLLFVHLISTACAYAQQ